MKESLKYWSVAILAVIGGFNVMIWIFNISDNVESLWSSSVKYELQDEKNEENAKNAYSRGRQWGEIAAQYYSDNREDLDIDGNYRTVAKVMLDNRHADFYCWYADDCGSMPNNDELLEQYHVDKTTGYMPIYAFSSGFTDSFVEYMELYD